MNERTFGKMQNQIHEYGLITDLGNRKEFTEILDRLIEEVIQYSDEYSESEYSFTIKEILDLKEGSVQVQKEKFSDKVDILLDTLDEGDYDDAFGSEGWRAIVGWR